MSLFDDLGNDMLPPIDLSQLRRTPEGRGAIVGGWQKGRSDVLFSRGDRRELGRLREDAASKILCVRPDQPFNLEAAIAETEMSAYISALQGLTLENILK